VKLAFIWFVHDECDYEEIARRFRAGTCIPSNGLGSVTLALKRR
jgi:hypothetical protein